MINQLALKLHENNKAKGFYDQPKNIGEMLALFHSEVSEALEADRKDRYCTANMNVILGWTGDDNFKEAYNETVKGTFEEEMADIAIRLFDMCAFKGIDLEAHIEAKMRFNTLREYKHGKKY
jgi:NTP pyrophosphatase (non-canonical NTP hydrolase)